MSVVVPRTRTEEVDEAGNVDPLPQVSVLLVDDRRENLLALEVSLESLGQRLVCATSGEAALRAVLEEEFAVILMDVRMPGLDGFETLALLRQRERSRHIPIIFLTAYDEQLSQVRGYMSGAVDYLRKPIDPDALRAKVRVFVHLRQNELALRAANEQMETRVADRTRELAQANDALRREIEHRKQVERQLIEQAGRDPLTGLPNRKRLVEHLEHAFGRWRRDRTSAFGVMMVDLDRFKSINDTLGHLAGDELLLEVSRRISACIRSVDTAARLGGDELAILLDGVTDVADATRTADRIHRALAEPFILAGRSVKISASIGIATVAERHARGEELLRDADAALYRAKDAGRSCFQVFDDDMREELAMQVRDEAELRGAVEGKQLRLHYQPIVDLGTGAVTGFEGLLRWHHPTRGVIMPDQFIPLAEDTGLIRILGKYAVECACAQLASWRDAGHGAITIAINVSAQQLVTPAFSSHVASTLAKRQLSPAQLGLELTESTMMFARGANELGKLRRAGLPISLDDFGTGYSCLSQLQRLEVGAIKIDRSFIAPIGTADERIEIVQAIIQLAHSLGLVVVAEGVETPTQLARLRELRCDRVQGFLLSPPVEADAAAELLRSRGIVQMA